MSQKRKVHNHSYLSANRLNFKEKKFSTENVDNSVDSVEKTSKSLGSPGLSSANLGPGENLIKKAK